MQNRLLQDCAVHNPDQGTVHGAMFYLEMLEMKVKLNSMEMIKWPGLVPKVSSIFFLFPFVFKGCVSFIPSLSWASDPPVPQSECWGYRCAPHSWLMQCYWWNQSLRQARQVLYPLSHSTILHSFFQCLHFMILQTFSLFETLSLCSPSLKLDT